MFTKTQKPAFIIKHLPYDYRRKFQDTKGKNHDFSGVGKYVPVLGRKNIVILGTCRRDVEFAKFELGIVGFFFTHLMFFA